jgi:hypothetical protein
MAVATDALLAPRTSPCKASVGNAPRRAGALPALENSGRAQAIPRVRGSSSERLREDCRKLDHVDALDVECPQTPMSIIIVTTVLALAAYDVIDLVLHRHDR